MRLRNVTERSVSGSNSLGDSPSGSSATSSSRVAKPFLGSLAALSSLVSLAFLAFFAAFLAALRSALSSSRSALWAFFALRAASCASASTDSTPLGSSTVTVFGAPLTSSTRSCSWCLLIAFLSYAFPHISIEPAMVQPKFTLRASGCAGGCAWRLGGCAHGGAGGCVHGGRKAGRGCVRHARICEGPRNGDSLRGPSGCRRCASGCCLMLMRGNLLGQLTLTCFMP